MSSPESCFDLSLYVVMGLTLAASAQMHTENVTVKFFTPPAAGTAWENDTCIGVRWQWMSFPASGHRSKWGGEWKSSSPPPERSSRAKTGRCQKEAQEPPTTVEQRQSFEGQRQPCDETGQNTMPRDGGWV
ncbi:hypothetical protein PpBr36_07584 [Pyricularia pennisetigena]|uniref:hypothetical protein n=1 Tax=Pyricularia pennisetigena TaxID=1578925 RepID=UPI00114F5C4C|nr:hypothetical protein PpBr36_07584 [Pyricularia pennisetigena]TLS25174.1 hypothetical protein PpBr36_07584 [Pyricularia pennisetigena]